MENKLNAVRGGNTDVAALPIERRACPCAIEAIFFPYENSSRKAATVEPTEHLKTAGQL